MRGDVAYINAIYVSRCEVHICKYVAIIQTVTSYTASQTLLDPRYILKSVWHILKVLTNLTSTYANM